MSSKNQIGAKPLVLMLIIAAFLGLFAGILVSSVFDETKVSPNPQLEFGATKKAKSGAFDSMNRRHLFEAIISILNDNPESDTQSLQRALKEIGPMRTNQQLTSYLFRLEIENISEDYILVVEHGDAKEAGLDVSSIAATIRSQFSSLEDDHPEAFMANRLNLWNSIFEGYREDGIYIGVMKVGNGYEYSNFNPLE